MTWSILADAASESGKVWMAISLSLARTVIWATVALMTVPSSLGCETFFGLTTLTTMGTAVSIAVSAAAAAMGAGTWACAKEQENAAANATRVARRRTGWEKSFIRSRRWRCEAISESECPEGSWPAWQPHVSRARIRGRNPDRPGCAGIRGSGDRA